MVNTHLITFIITFVNTNQSFIVNSNQIKEALKLAEFQGIGGYKEIADIKEFDRAKGRFVKTSKDRVIGTVTHDTESLRLLSAFKYIPVKHFLYTY